MAGEITKRIKRTKLALYNIHKEMNKLEYIKKSIKKQNKKQKEKIYELEITTKVLESEIEKRDYIISNLFNTIIKKHIEIDRLTADYEIELENTINNANAELYYQQEELCKGFEESLKKQK